MSHQKIIGLKLSFPMSKKLLSVRLTTITKYPNKQNHTLKMKAPTFNFYFFLKEEMQCNLARAFPRSHQPYAEKLSLTVTDRGETDKKGAQLFALSLPLVTFLFSNGIRDLSSYMHIFISAPIFFSF